jgi:glycosyltransferase involved in cell wall biosynthesis
VEIIIVVPKLVKTGGMDRANLGLATRASSRGHHVVLVTHRADPSLFGLPNVRVVPVPCPLGLDIVGEVLLGLRAQVERRRLPSAIVLANGGNYDRAEANWVHYVHAAEKTPPAQRGWRRFYDRAKRWRNIRREGVALRRARLIIADSKSCRDDVIAHHRIDPSKAFAIYYGIDDERFNPLSRDKRTQKELALGLTPTRRRCLFVGGIGDRRKGLDTLLSAWRDLTAELGWDAELVVVGTGRSLQTYQMRAKEWRIEDSVKFLGFRNDVDQLLQITDCFVAPTRYEPYGLAVHEAICSGVPAIVSATAGVAERYPERLRRLLLEKPDDAAELARVLREWRSNESSYADDFRKFGAELATRTWDDMADEMLELLLTRARTPSKRAGANGGGC